MLGECCVPGRSLLHTTALHQYVEEGAFPRAAVRSEGAFLLPMAFVLAATYVKVWIFVYET